MLTVNKKQITKPRQSPSPPQANCFCKSHNNKKSKSFVSQREKATKVQSSGYNMYCGTCNKKSNENQKPNIPTSTLQPPSTKLLSAIVQFHSNLSRLPLDLLITHSHPKLWLSQQYQTLAHLKEKLSTFLNAKNHNKKGEVDGEYYISRLQSVEEMLNNINNNVGMLQNLYDQELNRYDSGLGSIEAQSSSLQSSRQCSAERIQSSGVISRQASGSRQTSGSKISDNRNLSKNKDDCPTKVKKWEQVLMKENEKFAKQQSIYEINEFNEGKGDNQSDVYEEMMNNFHTNLKALKTGNFGNNTTSSKDQTFKKQSQSDQRKRSAHGSQCETINFLSTCKSENNQNQTHCLADNHIDQEDIEDTDSQSQQNVVTKRTKKMTFQSLSQLIAKSSLMEQNTLRSNQIYHQFAELVHQNEMQSKTKMEIGSLKHLLKEINEQKCQIVNKNKQIQSLLMTQQELESVIQLYKNKEQQQKESSNYSALRIQNLQTLVDKFEKQISHLKNCDREIREAMKNQTIFINNLQKQKQDLQKMMNSFRLQMETCLQESEKLNEESKGEIKKLKKSERVCHQKMQIYKQKYYSLLHESELKKIVQDSSYEGKASKVKQIWGILAEHKNNLETIDEKTKTNGIIQAKSRISSSLKQDHTQKLVKNKESSFSPSNYSKQAFRNNSISRKYKQTSPNVSQINQQLKQRNIASFSHLSFPNQSHHYHSKNIENGSYSFDPFEEGEMEEEIF